MSRITHCTASLSSKLGVEQSRGWKESHAAAAKADHRCLVLHTCACADAAQCAQCHVSSALRASLEVCAVNAVTTAVMQMHCSAAAALCA
jgi:hypothetical protein